ncbi:MAG TPA: glycerol-3-phosphate dehydrogenase/oxidase [Bryobacteraceae bacterium]|nr:glycerol-3-phosphate dehydrogenase/oxidase [Bryobacteraceae bacterium]
MTPAVHPDTRQSAIERLRSETFDVLILGGGINGAGTARDLALRGKLNIGLVEQNHFSSGTSGKNSHLIHGGLRYLKQLDFRLVREALRERAVLLKIAPHLVDPQPFLMPLAGPLQSLYYDLGLTIYDFFGSSRAVPWHRRLSFKQVRELEPGLAAPGMTGAMEFYDAQVRSARLVLENIFEAVRNGAACANYVRAESHQRDENYLWRVQLTDSISGETFEARARALIDSTGPWARDPSPRLVRGSHLVMPRLNASKHAIAYFDDDGRIVFFIPWGERGERTLIGTTDVDHDGSADDVHISDDEVRYLQTIAARIFPASARMEPVAAFSSLRPLLVSHASATKATREHHIYRDPQGMIRITGGKYTTYRAMAEEAADLAVAEVAPGLQSVHLTAKTPLNGNTPEAIRGLLKATRALSKQYNVVESEIIMLIRQYGVLTTAVLDYVETAAFVGRVDVDTARFVFAARHEMAIQPRDFMEVSTSLGLEGHDPPVLPASI